MKSIDTYLCKQPKKEYSFSFCGRHYFVGDTLGNIVRQRINIAVASNIVSDFGKAAKLSRFADTGFVDCKL